MANMALFDAIVRTVATPPHAHVLVTAAFLLSVGGACAVYCVRRYLDKAMFPTESMRVLYEHSLEVS